MRCRRKILPMRRCDKYFICPSADRRCACIFPTPSERKRCVFRPLHIARPVSPASSSIDPASDRPLTFAGSVEAVIPPGAELISDPVDYAVAPLSDLAVTFHLQLPPARQTGHPGSRATSYYVHGDQVSAATLVEPKHVDHWYQVSEIDVQAPPGAAAVVALGDSITDGHGATTNGNDRWTDVLAGRLQGSAGNAEHRCIQPGHRRQSSADRRTRAECIGTFRSRCACAGGRSLGHRLRRSKRSGRVGTGWRSACGRACAIVERVIAAYQQIDCACTCSRVARLRGDDYALCGVSYYHPGPLSEADRQAVNRWIRASGNFDAVIDFDSVVRDPQHPDQLLPAYDCGDHLHPSPAGYKAMGDAIPLSLFDHAN